MTADLLFTPSGVRLRRRRRRPGPLNWLFLPGGPGIGSESLHELADALDAPGDIWMVDLPGDGSNRAPPGAGPDPFAAWPGVVVEAARALPNVVFAGHSTGGMYLLATPGLERHLLGLALVDTAPDCTWHPRYVAMTQRDPCRRSRRPCGSMRRIRATRTSPPSPWPRRPGTSPPPGWRRGASSSAGCPTTAPPWPGLTPISTTAIARPGGHTNCPP